MITLIIYGLDQFVVGDLSRDLTRNLAKLYEVSEDEINFVAPNDMVFHNGVEQTSWNILIQVIAPMKVSVLQEFVKEFIIKSIGDTAIHKTVIFNYYSQDNYYSSINENYPRYLTDDNSVEAETEDFEDKEEGEGEDDIYTGDMFEDIEEREPEEDECECEDDDCDCNDHDCHCHHHHN